MTDIIKVNIPNFPWFYESILSSLIDSEEEREIEYLIEEWKLKEWSNYNDLMKIISIDYKKEREKISKSYFSLWKQRVAPIMAPIWITILEYSGLYSPREYNFSTDSVEFTVEIEYEKVISFLNENKDDFSKYIERENTSYDWFFSFLSNDFDNYIEEIKQRDVCITQVIDFIIKKEWGEEYSIHCDILQDIEYYIDYKLI